MNAEEHIEKARRFERSAEKLDPAEDCESVLLPFLEFPLVSYGFIIY